MGGAIGVTTATDHRLGRSFRLLWTAATVSAFGDGVRYVAFPLLAADLTTDPRGVSPVFAAGYLPRLLFGLISGAVADRVDRRVLMWRVDLGRAVVLGLFAVSIAGRPPATCPRPAPAGAAPRLRVPAGRRPRGHRPGRHHGRRRDQPRRDRPGHLRLERRHRLAAPEHRAAPPARPRHQQLPPGRPVRHAGRRGRGGSPRPRLRPALGPARRQRPTRRGRLTELRRRPVAACTRRTPWRAWTSRTTTASASRSYGGR
ncbi:MFS transporter [Actinoplanes sp. NPDC049596]|uniref:MFS transporter n=1 Tax=unclassified Actinoplanes TaxID=2626549 RepID=UPI003434CEB9